VALANSGDATVTPFSIRYSRTHHESMQYDRDEVFRFLWENRGAPRLEENAYTTVDSVLPCYRIAADGFFLRETVAVYSQQIKLEARELGELGINRPVGMPLDQFLTIYGGTLIFDESGRLKYNVRNRIRNAKRQNPRLQYLWDQVSLTTKKSFAALHLERVLRGHMPVPAEAISAEDNHAE
jgi:hypothetical protein